MEIPLQLSRNILRTKFRQHYISNSVWESLVMIGDYRMMWYKILLAQTKIYLPFLILLWFNQNRLIWIKLIDPEKHFMDLHSLLMVLKDHPSNKWIEVTLLLQELQIKFYKVRNTRSQILRTDSVSKMKIIYLQSDLRKSVGDRLVWHPQEEFKLQMDNKTSVYLFKNTPSKYKTIISVRTNSAWEQLPIFK